MRPEHFATVLDTVSDAVLTINRDFIITGFNRAAERLTGHRRFDVIGRHCYEVLRSNGCQTLDRCPMTLALRVGSQLGTREVAILNRANEEALVRITFTPLLGFEGEIVGGAETFRAADAPTDASLPTRSAALSILKATERRAIEDVLQRTGWNRTVASRELGVSRITLWRKMRKLGIKPTS